MMATVPHVTSGLGLRKFQADGFLLTRVYRHREKNDHTIYSCVDKHTFWNVGYELYIHTADCLKRLHCGYKKSSHQN